MLHLSTDRTQGARYRADTGFGEYVTCGLIELGEARRLRRSVEKRNDENWGDRIVRRGLSRAPHAAWSVHRRRLDGKAQVLSQ